MMEKKRFYTVMQPKTIFNRLRDKQKKKKKKKREGKRREAPEIKKYKKQL